MKMTRQQTAFTIIGYSQATAYLQCTYCTQYLLPN